MGFRFHKSLKLIPGVRLNLNKGIPSVSVGGKGVTFNINKNGGKTTVGLPGTGMSYSETTNGKRKGGVGAILLLVLGAIVAFVVNYLRGYLPSCWGQTLSRIDLPDSR